MVRGVIAASTAAGSSRPASRGMTFGYHRVGVGAALVMAAALVISQQQRDFQSYGAMGSYSWIIHNHQLKAGGDVLLTPVKELFDFIVTDPDFFLGEAVAVGRIEQYQKQPSQWHKLDELPPADQAPLLPPMATLQILGGRKEKIRAGDVLGALTGPDGGPALTREQIGKISVTEFCTFVAVDRSLADDACRKLNAGKIKGKSVRARVVRAGSDGPATA